MAARKTGLGKGLDGLFPSYMEKPAAKEKKSSKKEKSTVKNQTKASKSSIISYDEIKEDIVKKTDDEMGEKDREKIDRIRPDSTRSTQKLSGSKQTVSKKAEANQTKTKQSGTKAVDAKKTNETPTDTMTENEKAETVKTAIENTETVQTKTNKVSTVKEGDTVVLDINLIEPNRNQPRSTFDEDNLNELAESIKMYGIISPIVVADKGDYYEIIAGERRWRAARIAGLKEIPVIIRAFDEQKVLEVSLIENIQREDLNAIEEALAFKRLSDEFSLTQDEVSVRVSKSRSAITNALRLLKLDPRVQEMVKDEKISSGHARALLAITDPDRQFEMAVHVFDEKLSVREVEKLIKTLSRQPKEKTKPMQNTAMDIICREMEDRMKSVLGTKVSVTRKNEKRGKIEIEYYSPEELERLYELLSSLS